MLICDHWYVACPSSQLERDRPRAVQIGEHRLVAYRDGSGRPHALLDRCPHRGVRLSLGRVVGDRLACGYHGWEFSTSGELECVPSLDPCAKRPRAVVPSFPTREVDHYVWVWMAGEHRTPTHEPALRGIVPADWIQHTAIWKTAVLPAVENQLDLAHTPFAHPGIYPGHPTAPGEIPPLAASEYECRSDGRSVVLFSPPSGCADAPAPALEESALALFELPYRNYVFLHQLGVRAIYNWVPLGKGMCRLEFMAAEGIRERDGEVRVEYLEEELELLAQDRRLLESAQLWRDSAEPPFERSVQSDAPQLMARRLLERALRGSNARSPTERRVYACRA